MKPIARYSVTSGLSGCYMPDTHYGEFEVTTRRDLMSVIREHINMADFPKSSIREVKARRLWSFIKRHGSSTAHFSIVHKGFEIAFHGLTEDEYNEMQAQGD